MPRLQVFVSSRTKELRNERLSVKEALTNDNIKTFVFEDDAGAKTESPSQVYTEKVSHCDIYIGIFRSEFSRSVVDEYNVAADKNKEVLIYISDYYAENRDPKLAQFLTDLQKQHTTQKFENYQQLRDYVARDVIGILVRRFKDMEKSKSFAGQTALEDLSVIRPILQQMAPMTPDPLREINLVASEITAVWNANGYKIINYKISENGTIDLEGEIPLWAGNRKALLKCVEGEVTRWDVADVQDFVRQKPEYVGFVLAYSRISEAAKSLAETNPKVIVERQDQFYNRLLSPDKYIEMLTREYESSEISKYYVDLDCHRREYGDSETETRQASSGNLVSYVDAWLKDRTKKQISILGEYGTGKTWFCKLYTQKALKAYIDNPINNRFPILVSLRDYSKSFGIKQMITDLLINRYKFGATGGLTYEAFQELNKQGRLLLIFDGFDEMASLSAFL